MERPTSEKSRKLTIIFGAGASTGSVVRGQTSQSPIVPPITKDLFSTRYEGYLNKFNDVYSSVVSISHELENGKSLEDFLKNELGGISEYESLTSHRKKSLNQLPLYLQYLFSEIGKSLGIKTLYSRLVRSVFNEEIQLTFITLNYDLLLDLAIERVSGKTFTGFGNYVDQKDKWILVKPHGSVNWFRQILTFTINPSNDLTGWKDIVRRVNLLKDLDNNIVFLDINNQFNEGFVGQIPYYPALAIPNNEYTPIYPLDELKTLLEERLKECQNFLFIGFSAWDEDILEILNKTVKKVKTMLVVGKSDAEGIYDRIVAKAPQFEADNLSKVLYNKGFESLMRANVDIKNFLNQV